MTSDQTILSPQESRFSVAAFLLTLVAVAFVYAGLASFLFISAPSTYEKRGQRLASQTVVVEWNKEVSRPAIARPQRMYGPPKPSAAATDASAPALGSETASPAVTEKTVTSALAVAPAEGLYENTPEGKLPVVRQKDGMTPFQAYRRPFNLYGVEKPAIALGVLDIGLSSTSSDAALRLLPPAVSIILSPYSESIDLWNNEARGKGHETWLYLPMETENFPETDPGPHTLLISAPERENQTKLNWVMSRTTGYAGILAAKDAAFMNAANDMRPVLGSIFTRGLGFIDSSNMPGPIPQSMAIGMKAPYAAVDVWIDETATEESISASLQKLEAIAREKGSAIGIISPIPLSYQKIQNWAAESEAKGFVLAPLSAITGQ